MAPAVLFVSQHTQPLCCNITYRSRIVLLVGGSVRYTVRNHRCTQLTRFCQFSRQNTIIPCPRHVTSRLPRSDETCRYGMVPSTQKFGDITYIMTCSFLLCLFHVAQLSSKIPQQLMNCHVLRQSYYTTTFSNQALQFCQHYHKRSVCYCGQANVTAYVHSAATKF
jgi:hypothetical protein